MLRSISWFAIAVLSTAVTLASPASQAAEFVVRPLVVPEMKAVFGEVESRTVVPARARISGTIGEIGISEGSGVKEGEVIALVVDDKIALQLAAAEARVKALQSQLANARLAVDRAQQLQTRGVTAQSQLDAANTQLSVVANQVAAAEAEKAVIVQTAREGRVLAPASGRVLTVPVTPGSVILAGEEIARVATGPYYLRLSLPERYATQIEEGASVEVEERGRNHASGTLATKLHGKIVKVYPEIVDGRVIADVDVDNIGNYFVNERTLVSIPIAKRSVLAVPPEAVQTLHGIDYVRIATVNGTLDVAVILGERLEVGGDKWVVVLTGLHDGDKVVLP
ncbi:MAG: efflux RND transporter periplasmic adaptor subunit [Mesorhizobium sp.]|nr:efflux RND transporter periplasmic adaptor subunit [Mesorhizobium sp.]MBN9245020.1 efflux RND transporter periplasmic adaptor subunit [Mesorhizobium sp.]